MQFRQRGFLTAVNLKIAGYPSAKSFEMLQLVCARPGPPRGCPRIFCRAQGTLGNKFRKSD